MQSPTSPAVGLPFFHFLHQSCPTWTQRKAETLQCASGQKKLQEKPCFLSKKQERGLTVRKMGDILWLLFPFFPASPTVMLWLQGGMGEEVRHLTL